MKMIWALQDAKNRFSEVVDRAMEDGPRFVLCHGREAVVVVSAAEYRKLSQPRELLLEFMRRSPLYGAQDIEFVRDNSQTHGDRRSRFAGRPGVELPGLFGERVLPG